jgi:DNA-directed RNA polymerase beta' subunit
MNIHFPRKIFFSPLYRERDIRILIENHIARAEAELIANTDNQYLVPTSGKPLRGLIQDHVVAGVWMTSKATFFTREEYHQLIYGALRPEDETIEGVNPNLKLLPPSIWKPRALWTGKQVVSSHTCPVRKRTYIHLDINHTAKHHAEQCKRLKLDLKTQTSERFLGKGFT